MEFKVITTEEEFLAERETWTNLYNQKKLTGSVTPFQTWEWNFYWWKNRENKNSLFIIKAHNCNDIEGYAPLVVKKKMVEFIGGRDMDYGRFLIKNRFFETIGGFIDVIKKYRYGFALQEMNAKDTQLHIVQRYLEGQRRYLVRRTTRTMFVEINSFSSFGEYLNTLSVSMRKKLRNMPQKHGIIISRENYSDALKKEITTIFESRQTVRGGSKDISWAYPILENMSKCELLEIYVARIKGIAAGFSICFKGYKSKHIWLSAFHMDYETCHTGKVLRCQVIRDGFEEGCNVIDFMRGDYDFKTSWNAQIITNNTIYLYRNTFKYLKYKFWYWFRPKLKKLLYTLKIKGRKKRKKHAK